MPQLGADVEQLEALSKRFKAEAQTIEQMVGKISGEIKNVWWQGLDADQFRSRWDGDFVRQLRGVANSLQEASSSIAAQAKAQREVSRS